MIEHRSRSHCSLKHMRTCAIDSIAMGRVGLTLDADGISAWKPLLLPSAHSTRSCRKLSPLSLTATDYVERGQQRPTLDGQRLRASGQRCQEMHLNSDCSHVSPFDFASQVSHVGGGSSGSCCVVGIMDCVSLQSP